MSLALRTTPASAGNAIATRPRVGCVPGCRFSQAHVAKAVQRDQGSGEAQQQPQKAMLTATSVAAGLALLLSPVSGPAVAALDTSTKQSGAAAKVEGSNLQDISGVEALAQLTDVIFPKAEAALEKLDTPQARSALGQLNGLTDNISQLNERAEKGVSDQEIKSGVSAIEQELNAAKAIAGLE